MREIRQLISAAVLLFLSAGAAGAATWSETEREHALAREGDWLVIKVPDGGGCFIKQSFVDDPAKMELLMEGSGMPVLMTPFTSEAISEVIYRVDNGPTHSLPLELIGSPEFIPLTADIVPALRAGYRLFVRIKPRGQPVREQEFNLVGFTAASRWLEKPACRD